MQIFVNEASLIGATPKVIEAAEDREKFRSILDELNDKNAYLIGTQHCFPQEEMACTT